MIFFVPLHNHLIPLFEAVVVQANCKALVGLGRKRYKHENVNNVIHTRIHCYSLGYLRKFFRIETTLPIYIRKYQKILFANSTNCIVCFDFFHWYTLQAINYVKKYPATKLVIYSETKEWPQNKLSKFAMTLFLKYLKRNKSLVSKVLVYTNEGKAWWAREAPEFAVAVLPAPVDTEVFQPIHNKDWLPNGTLRILMNARYSAYKRHEDLFTAVANLLQQGKKVHITLIGRADSGRERVEKLVEGYQVSEHVTFLDPLPIEKMPELYHAHDVLVLPSYNEAIGMVVPEAMACGVPTITSDTVGANVYVKEGETGWVYPTGDVGALAAALRDCCDPKSLAERGAAARAHIEANYSIPIIADRFLGLVDDQS